MSGPASSRGSVFEQPAFVRLEAGAMGGRATRIAAGGAELALVRCADGVLRTTRGLPRPTGERLDALAVALTLPGVRVEATLSPLGNGPVLIRELCARGGELVGERQICIVDLGAEDPVLGFERHVHRVLDLARACGATSEVGALQPWLGGFLRAQRETSGAPARAGRSDAYLTELAELGHYQVTVRDELGVAAAVLFLTDGREAYLHLGARRVDPGPVTGAMNLALVQGVRHAWATGHGLAILGGGHTDHLDDPLLRLKSRLAGRTLPRYTVSVGAGDDADERPS